MNSIIIRRRSHLVQGQKKFRVVILDRPQRFQLSSQNFRLLCRFCNLDINLPILVPRYEIDFAARQCADADMKTAPQKLKINDVFQHMARILPLSADEEEAHGGIDHIVFRIDAEDVLADKIVDLPQRRTPDTTLMIGRSRLRCKKSIYDARSISFMIFPPALHKNGIHSFSIIIS